MTLLFVRLIITRAVVKETNNNMIFAVGVLGCYTTNLPLSGKLIPWRTSEGSQCASDVAVFLRDAANEQNEILHVLKGCDIEKCVSFWRALRQLRT